ARASHCIHPDLPRSGDAPDQLNRVSSEARSKRRPTSRINSAPAYSNVNRNCSAMAARGHGDHAPVSIKLGRNCRRATNDCESHRQSEGAHTIANHESAHRQVVLAHKRSPGDGGTPGLRVPFGGEPVMGRETHHKPVLYTPLCI